MISVGLSGRVTGQGDIEHHHKIFRLKRCCHCLRSLPKVSNVHQSCCPSYAFHIVSDAHRWGSPLISNTISPPSLICECKMIGRSSFSPLTVTDLTYGWSVAPGAVMPRGSGVAGRLIVIVSKKGLCIHGQRECSWRKRRRVIRSDDILPRDGINRVEA